MSGDTRNSNHPFEEDLDAIRHAWQGLQPVEPPDLIDQSVRTAARRALPARNRWQSMRWIGSLATAAVVVLALAIVIQQDQEGPVPPMPKTDGFRLDESAKTAAKGASEADVVEQASSQAELRSERAPPPAAAEDPTARDAVTTTLQATHEESAPVIEPKAWIEEMLRLQQAGRLQELRAEVEAFRKAWPDHPLPPELQD